ncbi:MAG: hypothetical protein Q4G71_10005 [Pseudomonadota bacterium]|nr:hypothetical protein [Pseudomonadota bacterium]
MAQPQLESFKRRGLALALRTNAANPASIDPATHGVLLFNGTSGTEFDKIERPIDRPHFTGQPFAVGDKRAWIEGEAEMYPPTQPGTGEADCGVLLLPAGMTSVKDSTAGTTRYNPVSSGIAVADAKWWHAGTVKHVQAARADITGMAITIGDRPKFNVRLQGDYNTVAAEAVPSITLPDVEPVVARADNTKTYISVAGGTELLVWAKQLSVDIGNTITSKEYTSHKETGISDRQPTFTLRIAKTDLADFNPWSTRDSNLHIAARLRLTQADGRYTELGIRGQIEQINEVDIDGDYGWELTGPCVASDVGGDELHLEFGGA